MDWILSVVLFAVLCNAGFVVAQGRGTFDLIRGRFEGEDASNLRRIAKN